MQKTWYSIVLSVVIAGAAQFVFMRQGAGCAVARTTGLAAPAFILPSTSRHDGPAPPPASNEAETPSVEARSATGAWVVECVDCPTNEGSIIEGENNIAGTSLVVDEAGYPHVAFLRAPDGGTGSLYYGFQDAAGWHFDEVRSGGIGGSEDTVSLALDSDANPHLGYVSNYGDGVWYAYRDPGDGTWHHESVDVSGFYASLALDGDGSPHMSYQHNATTWTYAHRDAGVWHTKPLAEFSYFAASHTSIAVDGSGHPHIGGNGDLAGAPFQYDMWYATHDGTTWYTGTVDTDIGWHSRLSLKVGDDGCAHIAYYHADEWDLRHAARDMSGWHVETVDSEGLVGLYPSLALGGDGYPHIAYYDDTHDDLKAAYQDASGWYSQTLDSKGDVGHYPALDVGGDGYPRVVYYDATNDELKVAYQAVSGWHIEIVDLDVVPAGFVGLHTAIAVGDDAYPHVSYYDWSGGNLKYSRREGSGWYSQTVDSDGDVGLHTSLALAGDGYPRISYYDVTNGDLKYAYQDAFGWHTQTVDSADDVGRYTSLALDTTAPYTPHISYYDATHEHPKYAYLGAAAWISVTVGRAFPGGTYTSLALDSSGYPHISYYEHYFGDLIHIRQLNGGSWLESVVVNYPESWNTVGMYNSLALDDLDNPYISYHDTFLGALRVATGWAPAGWSTMWTVDAGSFQDTSLDIDGGYGRVSYFDATNGRLKYARQDASGWTLQAVDSDGTVGQYTSLALDADGHPHISYYDADRSNLKVAYTTDRPIAAFAASPTTGVSPLTVVFTDTSTGGEVNAWLWSFGDGVTSSVQSPVHIYTAAGTYTVTLAVSGPVGSDSVSQTDSITVFTPVQAAFDAAPTSGPVPLEVIFTNTSSGDYATSLWAFGDGATSSLHSPTHTYIVAKPYTVALTVAGLGGTDTISRTDYITGHTPVQASFTATPTVGFAPLEVAFGNSSTGDFASSEWEFGDGLTSALESPTHTYTTIGMHSVTLTITGPGGTASVTKPDYISVTVRPGAPTAAFSCDVVSGTAPLTVTFTAVTTGTVEHWLWSLGDGGMAHTGPVVSHTYVESGTFDVRLTVSNTYGSSVVNRARYITVRTAELVSFVYLPLVVRGAP